MKAALLEEEEEEEEDGSLRGWERTCGVIRET